jgi:ElaB/YqjD/DUF883 family membrane-anchored ribosome-binding protein
MSKEQSGLLNTTGNDGEQSRDFEIEASRFRSAASRAVRNGKAVAQRWGRQSRIAAEELVGNATDRIKDDPVRSAAISFVIGLSLGALVGRWAVRQNLTEGSNVNPGELREEHLLRLAVFGGGLARCRL